MSRGESNETLACPRCGEPMAGGTLEYDEVDVSRLAWESLSRDPEEGKTFGSQTCPAQRCRACNTFVVDFDRSVPPPPTFEDRTTDEHGEPIPEALVVILREGDPRACTRAVEVFARIGEPALPLLRKLMQDENPDVRVDARRALKLIEESGR